MVDKANVTSAIIKWARESAHISVDDAAHKLQVSVEKLLKWEDGTELPTIKQAEKLALIYRRPFALFFLPEIPKDFQPLQDFRRRGAKQLSTAAIFIIRELREKQSWISNFIEENNEKKLPFVGKYSIKTKPEIVAQDILNVLKIMPIRYKNEPLKEWINNSENSGIFISRSSSVHSKMKIDDKEIQGFALSDEYAPFVFVNSGDWKTAQLFTLVHELAHIWIAESGISVDVENLQQDLNIHPTERFCNEVAATVLMPVEYMKSMDITVFNSISSIYKFSKTLGVSSFAFLLRAFKMQIINSNKYFELKESAEKEFVNYLIKEEEKKTKQKDRQGIPDPYLLRLNKNSRLLTQIILDSYKGGSITSVEASNLLNTKINHFNKLEAYLYR